MNRIRFIVAALLFLTLGACNDEAGKPTGNFGPSADDPVISVALSMTPNESVVFLDTEVQFAWTAITRSGQRYNGLAGDLIVPPEFTAVDDTPFRYRASEIGQFEVNVRLRPPYQAIEDRLLIEVTNEMPAVLMDYPTRGETVLRQSGGIEVLGRTIATSALTINGQRVMLDAEGRFRFPMTPNWGLNILTMEASGAGQTVTASPSFLYAESYQQIGNGTDSGIKVPDALLAAIADSFFDDGIHDPNNIDDLATVVEVILEDSDLAAAIQDSGILDDLGTQRDLGLVAGNQTTLTISTSTVSPAFKPPSTTSARQAVNPAVVNVADSAWL